MTNENTHSLQKISRNDEKEKTKKNTHIYICVKERKKLLVYSNQYLLLNRSQKYINRIFIFVRIYALNISFTYTKHVIHNTLNEWHQEEEEEEKNEKLLNHDIDNESVKRDSFRIS